jgi:hypothetical protein
MVGGTSASELPSGTVVDPVASDATPPSELPGVELPPVASGAASLDSGGTSELSDAELPPVASAPEGTSPIPRIAPHPPTALGTATVASSVAKAAVMRRTRPFLTDRPD